MTIFIVIKYLLLFLKKKKILTIPRISLTYDVKNDKRVQINDVIKNKTCS